MRNSRIPMFLILTGLAIVLLSVGCALTRKQILNRASESVVMVTNPVEPGGGTGFIVLSRVNGKVVKAVLTNAHVCDVVTAGPLLVSTDSSAELASVIRIDQEHDLCLITAPIGKALPVSDGEPELFDEVYVVGHPRLRPKQPSVGMYSGEEIGTFPERANEDGTCKPGMTSLETFFGNICLRQMTLARSTLFILPGNSGSPVLNEQGAVIGIVNSSNRDNQGGYIPLRFVKKFLDNE